MSMEIREEVRENWGTRTGFILAAVGSAVGLGNLWGFPYKLYTYGGAAFLIPYLIALVVIGIPMMILEFSIGHRAQRAAPDAFGRANRRFEFVGWWGILLGFVIITYYPVILAYCLSFLWYSIEGIATGGELPWAGQGLEGVKNAEGFFFNDYLGYGDTFALGSIRWHIVWPLLITWALMYLCICTGVKLVGKIVWLTVPLPWIMLAILTVRGLTLPGSEQGLAFYLDPDWSELAKPATWRFAFGQVFFSLSLAFGVMITYASFLHRRSDINNNAAIISLADLMTSFVAGLAVFATLGGMAYATQLAGQAVPVDKVVAGGPGLAFVAFPYALAQLPYSAWFSFIFFFALVTLGVDSGFSITESVLASVVDKTGWHRAVVLPIMSLVGLLLGLVFVTSGGGLNWLGTVDAFINGTWGIAFMGLLECVVLGWLYRIDYLRKHANERSDWRLGKWWDPLIRIVIPVVLGALVTWSLVDDWTQKQGFIRTPEGDWMWHNIVGLVIVALAPVAAILIASIKGVREPDTTDELPVANVRAGMSTMAAAVLSCSLLVAAFVLLLGTISRGGKVSIVLPLVLAAAGVISIVGIVIGHLQVRRDSTATNDPSWLSRFGGLLSTVAAGATVGLFFSYKTQGLTTTTAVDVEAPHISGATYVILAIISLILVVGFGWCFYRAVTAANGDDEDEERE